MDTDGEHAMPTSNTPLGVPTAHTLVVASVVGSIVAVLVAAGVIAAATGAFASLWHAGEAEPRR
jgi:hypothetical protein